MSDIRDLIALIDRRIALSMMAQPEVVRGVVASVDADRYRMEVYIDGAVTPTPEVVIPEHMHPGVGDEVTILRRRDGYLVATAALGLAGQEPTPADSLTLRSSGRAPGSYLGIIPEKPFLRLQHSPADMTRFAALEALGAIQAEGWDGSDWQALAGIGFRADSEGDGGSIDFYVRPTTADDLYRGASIWNDGTINLISGALRFPGTQIAQSSVNAFDDYEEGTWTPVATFATPGDLSVAYSSQVGYYTKMGRLVYVNGAVVATTFSHSTASGNFRLTGLPFVNAGTGVPLVTRYGTFPAGLSTVVDLTAWLGYNVSYIEFYNSRYNNAAQSITAAHATTGNLFDIRFEGCYHAAT